MTVSMRLGFVNAAALKEQQNVNGNNATVVAYENEAKHNFECVSLVAIKAHSNYYSVARSRSTA